MMIPMRVPKGFHIIGHRGASGYAPENTRAAFVLAKRMGITEVELDVQVSSDGFVVVCHDLTLERYGHGSLHVESSQWEELSRLDMGSWFSPFLYQGETMMLLEELLIEYGHQFLYHIELKGEESRSRPELVERVIAHTGMVQDCIVTSFSLDALARMKATNPSIKLGWLLDVLVQINRDILCQADSLGLYQLCPYAGVVSRELVTRIRGIIPEVRAWGIHGCWRDIISLMSVVVDASCDGVTIDWPDWFYREDT
jgi:glycerophosphoryl diester phosphodiesterase